MISEIDHHHKTYVVGSLCYAVGNWKGGGSSYSSKRVVVLNEESNKENKKRPPKNLGHIGRYRTYYPVIHLHSLITNL